MKKMSPETFFVGLFEEKGELTGHSISVAEPSVGAPTKENDLTDKEEKKNQLIIESDPKTFKQVIDSFTRVMETYRDFIPFLLALAPVASAGVVNARVAKFAKDKGEIRKDLSTEGKTYYELGIDHYRQFAIQNEMAISAIEGSRHLPEIMLIGLISAYDAYLARLLRLIFETQDEIVMTSEKTIKYSELKAFDSIGSARSALIDAEAEAIIRMSHHEQFSWMERKFAMKLREKLPVWPVFIEVCERRNLVTHTGGVVSKQYLQNCKMHGADVAQRTTGERIVTDIEYFRRAVIAVYEIGYKLGHVMWRKFARKEQDAADKSLSERAFELIVKREYRLAECILEFGTEVIRNHPSDKTRRMMIINRANSLRLMEKMQEAKRLLEKEDWSATGIEFQICVSAASGEAERLMALMKEAGPNGPIGIEDYRSWPIFRGYRTDGQFPAVFEEIFGVQLLTPKVLIMEENDSSSKDDVSGLPSTVH